VGGEGGRRSKPDMETLTSTSLYSQWAVALSLSVFPPFVFAYVFAPSLHLKFALHNVSPEFGQEQEHILHIFPVLRSITMDKHPHIKRKDAGDYQ